MPTTRSAKNHLFLGVLAVIVGTFVVSGCHRAEIIDRVPIVQPLSRYRSASIHLVAQKWSQDRLEEAADTLTERLTRAEIFPRVHPPWSAADLEIHVTLVDVRDEDHVVETFRVELVAPPRSVLAGAFDVAASSARTFASGGGGVDIVLDSEEWRAFEKAAGAIVRHLEAGTG